jgi:hypothetical protein
VEPGALPWFHPSLSRILAGAPLNGSSGKIFQVLRQCNMRFIAYHYYLEIPAKSDANLLDEPLKRDGNANAQKLNIRERVTMVMRNSS